MKKKQHFPRQQNKDKKKKEKFPFLLTRFRVPSRNSCPERASLKKKEKEKKKDSPLTRSLPNKFSDFIFPKNKIYCEISIYTNRLRD